MDSGRHAGPAQSPQIWPTSQDAPSHPPPPTVPLRQWEASLLIPREPIPPNPPRTSLPPAIPDDGTQFTQAFLRRGKWQLSDDDQVPPVERIRARILAEAADSGMTKAMMLCNFLQVRVGQLGLVEEIA